MARFLRLNKEFDRRRRYTKNFLNRQVHNSFLRDTTLSIMERQIIYQKIVKVRYSSSIVRLKNYCLLTGHSRSVYRDVKLNRNKFNQEVMNGTIPGCFLLLGRHYNSFIPNMIVYIYNREFLWLILFYFKKIFYIIYILYSYNLWYRIL